MTEPGRSDQRADFLKGQSHFLHKLADELREQLKPLSVRGRLEYCIKEVFPDDLVLVSSFGSESIILLELISEIAPDTPVIFLDTEKHFEETLSYVKYLQKELKLKYIKHVQPSPGNLEAEDPEGKLWQSDPDRCCYIRKTLPMISSLAPYRAWITGRKQFQNSLRQSLDVVEVANEKIKINPIYDWTKQETHDAVNRSASMQHPLIKDGYLSIGCAPCTSPVAPGEDDRSGRWRGAAKTECGIHLKNGRWLRSL